MKDGAQSVHRSVAILREVAASGACGARLTDVVEWVGLNKATTRRLLTALCDDRLLEQDAETRCYRLGVESHVIGTQAAGRFDIAQATTASVSRLAHISQDTVFVATPSGSYSLCTHREDGSFPIRTQVLSAGHRHPLGIGAGGLALLAALPNREVEAVIQANAAVVVENYPRYSRAELWRLIQETRARGHATNPGMVVPGSWAVGVAVCDEWGYPVMALSIAAIADRMSGKRRAKLAASLVAETDTLSAELAALRRTDSGDGPVRAPRAPTDGRRPGVVK